jgi:hypothetical protein
LQDTALPFDPKGAPMATDLKDLTQAAQDNILSVIKMSQSSVLETVKSVVDTVEKFTPDVPMPALPLIDQLPSPAEGLAIGFGFAEKLLETQKDFAHSLIEIMTPSPAAKAAAAPKPKAA